MVLNRSQDGDETNRAIELLFEAFRIEYLFSLSICDKHAALRFWEENI